MTQTALEAWVVGKFGEASAKQAVSKHAEGLVKASGALSPPVCVAKLARTIGIDPWPIYEPRTEGAIKVIDGRLRIVLRTIGKSRQSPSAIMGRTRFTYAHELAHTFFYDLKANPPYRLAPEGYHRIEEQLCNRAASHFLMPGFLLQSELSNVSELSPELLRGLAQKFGTSIQAIGYRVAEALAHSLPRDRFYVVSASVGGIRGTGLQKPRCLVCILSQNLIDRNIAFLQSYQGVDRVRRRISGRTFPWSLEEFFQRQLNCRRGATMESEEVVESPDGSVLELRVCHRTVAQSNIVWSEGIVRKIESTRTSHKLSAER